MKFLTLPLLPALLALTTTTTASPIDAAPRGDARGATVSRTDVAAAIGGLSPRNTRTCTIVNVATTVDCWYWPTHKKETQGSPPVKNHVVTSFKPNSKHEFVCYLPGQKVGGITSWDYSNNYGCFVPGYYTDAKCTHQALGMCWT